MPRVSRRMVTAFDGLTARYGSALDRVIAHRRTTLIIFALTLLVTAFLFYIIPKNLFPQQDTGQIAATTITANEIGFGAMSAAQEQVARRVLASRAVASVTSSIGIDGTNPTLNQGRLSINLKPVADRPGLASVLEDLRERVRGIPGITVTFQPVQDLTIDTEAGTTAYRFALQGADQDQVDVWGSKLAAALSRRRELANVSANSLGRGAAVMVDIDRDRAGQLGLSALAIDNALYDAFGQRIVSTIYTQSSQNRVILEGLPNMLASPDGLGQLYIPVTGGKVVPLSEVATIRTTTAPLVVSRIGQFPAATIGFDLAPGTSLGAAVATIEQVESEIGVPAAISSNFSGSASTFQSSLGNEFWLILAALVVVYIVLGVLYESFVHPVTILSTLPSAGIGALLALYLSGWGLGVIGIIGIVLLIGIVKKNAIMMIDFALAAMRTQGMAPGAAIRQAAHLRFRPIMMTTFAALFAALPLIFGGGMGHELREPLGLAIAGGLLLSQVLTLFTTPVIFLAFEDLRERWRPQRGSLVGAEA